MQLVVIGAGPIGLAAALAARRRGLDVTVLEKKRVGEAMRRWGGVKLFSPLEWNLPEEAQELLGADLPPKDALLTGPEMAERVLVPLSRTPPLAGRVREGHRVIAVGRAGLTRLDLPRHPIRAERPFRILVETSSGEEVLEAEIVLDASGVYDRANPLGAGGLPAKGERAAEARIVRHLGRLEESRSRLAGRRVLLIGHGHSAANALLMLEALAREAPQTRVIWAVRSTHRRPCVEVADDPLRERQRIADRANELAHDPPAFLSVHRRVSVDGIAAEGDGLAVSLSNGSAVACDAIVAMTGYRPDLSFLSELAIETCPVTEGAARLSRALTEITDCLSVPRVEPAALISGEPGFHLIGAKSYGRSRTFLIRTGLSQLDAIMEALP